MKTSRKVKGSETLHTGRNVARKQNLMLVCLENITAQNHVFVKFGKYSVFLKVNISF